MVIRFIGSVLYRLARLLTAEARYWETVARVEATLAMLNDNPEENPNA